MAASTDVPDSGAQGLSPTSLNVDDAKHFQYSMLLEHLIGDRRPIKDLNPAVMAGLPVPYKSDEQKMIERAMESCTFKAALACVGGMGYTQYTIKCFHFTCVCVCAYVLLSICIY